MIDGRMSGKNERSTGRQVRSEMRRSFDALRFFLERQYQRMMQKNISVHCLFILQVRNKSMFILDLNENMCKY